MADRYKNFVGGLRDPIQAAKLVVPSDTTDLSETTRAIYLGGTGDVQMTLHSGDIVTFSSMFVGWHPIRATRIWATDTTATNIIACS